MSIQSLASVKAQFSAVVDSVHNTHERVTVTRNGEPAAVIMAVDDLASLEETLEILRDEATLRALRQAEEEAATGQTIGAEELKALLDQRLRGR